MDPSASPSSPSPGALSPTRRRELARAARDAFPPMGVYAVRNLAAGTLQVRASRNVHSAINRTRFELQQGNCRDRALQQAWQQLGPEGLRFEVLELVRERSDPAFDHDAELALLLQLWTAELAPAAEGPR